MKLANRTGLLAASVALALTAAIMAVPLPYAALAQGVAWIPEQALVRAETEGFVDATPVADGAEVRAGDVLVVLRNPADFLADVRCFRRGCGIVRARERGRHVLPGEHRDPGSLRVGRAGGVR